MLLLVLASGCADRHVISEPTTPAGPGTWGVVAAACFGAVVLLALLVLLPSRQERIAGLAAWILALEAGAVVVVTAVVVAAALRTGNLLGQDDPATAPTSLIRLSGRDGDADGFYVLMAGLTAVLGGLAAAVLGLGARLAAGDATERVIAGALVALQAGASAAAAVLFVANGPDDAWLGVAAVPLPLLVWACTTCWPTRSAPGPTVAMAPARVDRDHG